LCLYQVEVGRRSPQGWEGRARLDLVPWENFRRQPPQLVSALAYSLLETARLKLERLKAPSGGGDF